MRIMETGLVVCQPYAMTQRKKSTHSSRQTAQSGAKLT